MASHDEIWHVFKEMPQYLKMVVTKNRTMSGHYHIGFKQLYTEQYKIECLAWEMGNKKMEKILLISSISKFTIYKTGIFCI